MSTRTSLSILLQQRGINLSAEDWPVIGLSNRLNIAAWVFEELDSADLARLYCLELGFDHDKLPSLRSTLQKDELTEILRAMRSQKVNEIRHEMWRIARRINDRPALPYFRPHLLDEESYGSDFICWTRGADVPRDQAGNRGRNQELPLVCLRMPRDRTKAACLEGSLNGKHTMLDTRSGGEMNFVFTWEDISWFRSGVDQHELLKIWHKMIPEDYKVTYNQLYGMILGKNILPYRPPPE